MSKIQNRGTLAIFGIPSSGFGDPFGVAQSFASSTNTSALGVIKSFYACTNTSAPRTLTISSSDIAKGTPERYWTFIVTDQTGGANANNITIATEGAETIDGAATVVITEDFGQVKLYSNGENLFGW